MENLPSSQFSKNQMQLLTETLEVICLEQTSEGNTDPKFDNISCSAPSVIPGCSSSLPIDLTSADEYIPSAKKEQSPDPEYPFPSKSTQLEKQARKSKREAQLRMWRAREERESREMRAQLRRQRSEGDQSVLFQPNPPRIRVNFALDANQVFEYTP
ncbi:hypothetical protein K493DRAFT_314719 [Basidiobolus meristosporus CBS 931.73]|uniref:Uncharacterized protein n=1 Tax=Basidiobolus meristosporus CBS 931.73 TaxID=1314790 RepID=A0A1Y1YDC4_9FUNG|nr:hypothetical protein K493DRAFT_314719 [Basidiobolus meristosporus CBS 931.73]|eukprot:ORX95992.1 hypothetical protein K493DRAFT_314719 [Basidiobolus meristosporus CBS 931.73]